MDSKTETAKPVQTTAVGGLDVTLLLDPGGPDHVVTIQLQMSAERVAREIPIVVGSLLFAQQQLRSINDPARLNAVEEIAATCRSAREGRLNRPSVPANARTAAAYRVEVLADGGFRINVDEKVFGILTDVAGGLTSGGVTTELLTSLREPYRTFYLEMLEAAIGYWRERRPSAMESTWVWSLALQRLNQLMSQGVENLGQSQTCANCKAVRPAGYPCLRCRAVPGETASPPTALSSSTSVPTPAVEETSAAVFQTVDEPSVDTAPSVVVASTPSPTVEPAGETSAAVATPPGPSPASTPSSSNRTIERTIIPAQEIPPDAVAAAEEPPHYPLASLAPRGVALLIDVVIALILGTLAGAGLTAILLTASAFGPTDDPQMFASAVATTFFALYFILGWTGGETFGMMIFGIQVVQQANRKRCGFFRAIARAFGYLLVIVAGFAVFYIGNLIDNDVLVFIPSQTPGDYAIRAIVGILSLYVMWLGTGQRIVGYPNRQTWGDSIAKTLVVRTRST